MSSTLANENILVEEFGRMRSGSAVKKYTLRNHKGLKISVINYGGTITSLEVTDAAGTSRDVVLGYDTLEAYEDDTYYLGCLIGRYANRIRNAEFELNGQRYQLEPNEGNNHLHGGSGGFHKVFWNISPIEENGDLGLELTYRSNDGEQGYPGMFDVRVCYLLRDNALEIRYHATTTSTTIVNLTQHSYFNLNEDHSRDVLRHQLKVEAKSVLETDDASCPTGGVLDITDTSFDFTALREIGMPLQSNTTKSVHEYDHCYLLNTHGELQKAAQLSAPDSSIVMDVWTTEPALQLYTGNYLNAVKGKNGTVYSRQCGVCLETQHYPDSPHHPDFPNTVLQPDEVYQSTTIYRFVQR